MTNKDELYKMFPIKSISIQTTGFNDGIILKFKTFYLKIYDDDRNGKNSYRVEGFRYYEENPIFRQSIPLNQFKKFASQFTRDNYLCGF